MLSQNKISVIVISLLGEEALAACLDRIGGTMCERIVMLPDGAGSADDWSQRHPAVRFIASTERPVPLRRLQGAVAATGEVVAFIEDTTLPGPGWCEAICEAFADPMVAGSGGPVEISSRLPARYQALACSEFGIFHPLRYRLMATEPSCKTPLQAVRRLPGNNFAYRRAALLETVAGTDMGIVEDDVNALILQQARKIVIHPAMAVTYAGIDQHGARLSTRWSHGRLYASERVLAAGIRARLVGLLKSPILPFVLFARSCANARVAIRPRDLPMVAIWLGVMAAYWSLGEAAGYVAGPGNSLESWR